MKILRHFEPQEYLASLEDKNFPQYDAFVLQGGISNPAYIEAQADPRYAYKYVNMLEVPPIEWANDEMMAWIRGFVPRVAGHVYPYSGREIWDYSLMNDPIIQEIAARLREFAAGSRKGVFGDVFFAEPGEWMFSPPLIMPPERRLAWRRNSMYLRSLLPKVMTNGVWLSTGETIYLERAGKNWPLACMLWEKSPESVLSVPAAEVASVGWLLRLALINPQRWIAFTDPDGMPEKLEQAYRMAALLNSKGWGAWV